MGNAEDINGEKIENPVVAASSEVHPVEDGKPNSHHDEESAGKKESNKTAPLLEALVPVPDIQDLPPFLTPKHREIQKQTSYGIAMVIGIIVILVSLTHGIALTIGYDRDSDTVAWWTIFGLIYGEAFLALIFLVAVLKANPGQLQREPSLCYPLPTAISTWIKSKDKDLRPMEHYLQDELNPEKTRDNYCTRCLIWRRQPDTVDEHPGTFIRYYHCNICQRCVRHWDHHCNVLGRCVGGKPTGPGNLKYFWALLVTGMLAYLTCLGSVLAGLIHSYDPKWVVPLFIGGLILINLGAPVLKGCIGGLSQAVCRSCC